MTFMEWLSIGTAIVTGLVAAVSTVAFMRGRIISILERLDSMERRHESRCRDIEDRLGEAHRRIDTVVRDMRVPPKS